MIAAALLERAYRRADAARWSVAVEAFRETLEASVRKAYPDGAPPRAELERYVDGLHLADLALACACRSGDERAWDHFIRAHRPVLYRAADALDRSGGAREIADSLYADLFGLREDASLFRYYLGRSSLATWLRAVLAQRHVDRFRAQRRTAPLDDERAGTMPVNDADPERGRIVAIVGRALRSAIGELDARARLRLKAYYEQDLTLAQIGRLTGEHEATVSRQLARARRALRSAIERQLRGDCGLTDAEAARYVAIVSEDAGDIDLRDLFGAGLERKIGTADRSE
jgi:RNA polymerase sigma factor (sigma-70 family)